MNCEDKVWWICALQSQQEQAMALTVPLSTHSYFEIEMHRGILKAQAIIYNVDFLRCTWKINLVVCSILGVQYEFLTLYVFQGNGLE